jgi:hypothetical protein
LWNTRFASKPTFIESSRPLRPRELYRPARRRRKGDWPGRPVSFTMRGMDGFSMRGMGDNRPRYIRIAVIVGVAALALGGMYYGVSRMAPKRPPPSEPAEEIDRSEYLHPLKTEKTTRGEELAPFAGFALSVDSDPPGAIVTVAGKVRGEAPVLADVSCSGTDKIDVRAEKAGYRPTRYQVQCRTDTLVKLTLQLQR